MRPLGTHAIAILLVFMSPAFAHADATAFIGTTTTPSNRPVRGFAFGLGLLIIGFEFEDANTSEDVAMAAPGIRTGMGNLLLQSPVPILAFLPYFTVGGGMYRETLGSLQETGVGTNVGGGAKISLAGPLRLRIDYRVFKLGRDALASPAHRVYAGLNLSF